METPLVPAYGESTLADVVPALAASLGIDGANTFDKVYRIDVRPVADGKFDYTEQGREREAGLGGASVGISGFKGKSKSFSFGKEMGPGADPNANCTDPSLPVCDTNAGRCVARAAPT